jgi:hypothetical protein
MDFGPQRVRCAGHLKGRCVSAAEAGQFIDERSRGSRNAGSLLRLVQPLVHQLVGLLDLAAELAGALTVPGKRLKVMWCQTLWNLASCQRGARESGPSDGRGPGRADLVAHGSGSCGGDPDGEATKSQVTCYEGDFQETESRVPNAP